MNRRKRILLYGFGPYRQFRDNITAKIIKSLPPAKGVVRVVFRVRFDRAQFVQALERHRPDIVLGLGQSSRRTLEIETRAANRRRAAKQSQARAIRKLGPRWLPTTLPLNLGRRIKRSKSAGDYVCNFSMYVMLDEIRRSSSAVQFGFMHIPHDAPFAAAAAVVAGAIKKLRVTASFARTTKPGSKVGAPSPT
jgi:pyrrolidone-carboxylate peptidase